MLDCESPLGIEFMKHQYGAMARLNKLGYLCIGTPQADNKSDIFLAKKSEDGHLRMYGIAEIKSRATAGGQMLTVEYLKNNGGYLISNDKLSFGQQASFSLRISFFVIVNLIYENKLLVWKITDDKGNFLDQFPRKRTKTRATVNGGEANRLNAFLQMNSKNLTIIE